MIKNGDIPMHSNYATQTLLALLCLCTGVMAAKETDIISYGVYSIPADTNKPTEDTYATIGTSYFGVFDGHKGDSVSQYLAKHLLERIKEKLEKLPNDKAKDIKQIISAAFQKIDNDMRRDPIIKPLSGAPGAVVVNRGPYTYVANIGSTRIIVFEKNKSRPWRSRNHTVNDPREEDRIIRERGNIRTGSSTVKVITDDCIEYICKIHKRASRAFGDFYEITINGKTVLIKPRGLSVVPDIKKFHMNKIRAIFIVTDGVWRSYGDKDTDLAPLEKLMKEALNEQLSPEEMAKTIVEKTRARAITENQKLDDMTALVILY